MKPLKKYGKRKEIIRATAKIRGPGLAGINEATVVAVRRVNAKIRALRGKAKLAKKQIKQAMELQKP